MRKRPTAGPSPVERQIDKAEAYFNVIDCACDECYELLAGPERETAWRARITRFAVEECPGIVFRAMFEGWSVEKFVATIDEKFSDEE